MGRESCKGCEGQCCLADPGLLGQETDGRGRKHTVPRESVSACLPSSSSHSVPVLPQPPSAFAPFSQSLLASGAAHKAHRPETLQGKLVLTDHWLVCLVVQLLVKSHLASSSSPFHPHPHACIPRRALSSSPLTLATALVVLGSFSCFPSPNTHCGCHQHHKHPKTSLRGL